MKIRVRKREFLARLASFLLAFLLVVSTFHSYKLKAEAAGLSAAIGLGTLAFSIIGGGATFDIAGQIGGNYDIGEELGEASMAAVTWMLLDYLGLDLYVGNQALSDGGLKSDYIIEEFSAFCEDTGKSFSEGIDWLMGGVEVTAQGVVQIEDWCGERWKDFLYFIFGSDTVYNSVSSIPDGKTFILNGKTFYSMPENYEGSKYVKFYSTTDRVFSSNEGIFYMYIYYTHYRDGKRLGALFFKDVNNNIDGNIGYIRNNNTNITIGSFDNSVSYLEPSSIFTGNVDFRYHDISNKVSETDAVIGEFQDGAEVVNWLNSINVSGLDLDGVQNALVGDAESAMQDSVYDALDSLTEDEAIILDPGVIDGVTSENDEVISLPIDDYMSILIAILNGIGTLTFPGIGEVALPGVLNPDVKIGEKAEEGVKVKDEDDELVAVVDLPGISQPVEDILDWGLGYISPTTGILSKFPFSIPYDLYLIVNALSGDAAVDAINADPKELTINNDLAPPGTTYEAASTSALSWHFTFTIPYGNTQTVVPLDIDLSDYEWVFRIIRYFTGILWLVGLLSWTRKESS